jgi:hypothetical protein
MPTRETLAAAGDARRCLSCSTGAALAPGSQSAVEPKKGWYDTSMQVSPMGYRIAVWGDSER